MKLYFKINFKRDFKINFKIMDSESYFEVFLIFVLNLAASALKVLQLTLE